jgi:hypothetical protein
MTAADRCLGHVGGTVGEDDVANKAIDSVSAGRTRYAPQIATDTHDHLPVSGG